MFNILRVRHIRVTAVTMRFEDASPTVGISWLNSRWICDRRRHLPCCDGRPDEPLTEWMEWMFGARDVAR
jgi:hypothetical protein